MRILLINPWIYDFKAYDLWLKPLGLLYLADFLFKSGHKIDFIDCLVPGTAILRKTDKFGTGKYYYEEIEKPEIYKDVPRKYKRYGMPIEAFKEKLRTISKPDVILITCTMTYWYKGAFEAIKIVKEFFPDTLVVLGGIYANLCREHAKKYSGADYVISKNNFEEFAKFVGASGRSPLRIQNLLNQYRPAYYLYLHLEYACVITSAGCPYSCAYCAAKYLCDEFYQRDQDDVVDEICGYAESGIKNIAFYDDALFFNKENHINKILDKIIEKKLDLNFHTPNGVHARFIDKKLARKLKEAGFKTIRLGFETEDTVLQNKIGNKVSNEEIKTAVKNLFEVGFKKDEIGAYIMTGMPGQSYDDILETVKFAKDLDVKVKFTQFSPIPHTKLGNEMLSKYDNADPLLHNNTYWLYKSPYISFEKIQKITKLSK